MTDTATAGNSPAAAANRALATTAQPNTAVEVAQDVRLLTLATRDDVERFETIVTIPPDYQYAIPIKGVKHPDGSWDNTKAKVGLLSDAYDYLNRVIGVTFFMPKTVFDQEGVESPNPIHRKDYILLRLGGVWYNPMGQLTAAIEDIEVDFNLVFTDKRANAKSATPVLDDNGQIVWDEAGNPELRLTPEDEMKCLRELTRLRAFGLRYPYTVARTRIMKLATGIRSLPLDEVRPFQLKVVGFRDKMTPQERTDKVSDDAQELFGQRPTDDDGKPLGVLTNDELADAGVDATEFEDAQQELANDDAAGGAARTARPTAAAPRGGAAQPVVGQLICGVPTVPKVDAIGNEVVPQVIETCLVVLDDEGKHVGPHKSASGTVPQTAG